MSRQVAAAGKPGPVTVVHTGSDRGGAVLLYGCTAAGLGAVLYFRVLRGWTFGDMLYATRRGLRDGLAQVSTGAAAGRRLRCDPRRACVALPRCMLLHRRCWVLPLQAAWPTSQAGG